MRTTPHATSYTADGSRADRVFAELKTSLLLGDFPAGVRLGEDRLAERYGVSRTPVREALLRLHAEKFVARHADGGYCPVMPDVVEMRHLYEVRIGLELTALRRPAQFGAEHDRAILADLREEWQALLGCQGGPRPDFVLLDEAFHCTLAEAAGNPVLVDSLRWVNERIRLVRMQDFLAAGRVETTVRQHLDIVEALLAGDPDRAIAEFDHHVVESFDLVGDRVAAVLTRMARRSHEARR